MLESPTTAGHISLKNGTPVAKPILVISIHSIDSKTNILQLAYHYSLHTNILHSHTNNILIIDYVRSYLVLFLSLSYFICPHLFKNNNKIRQEEHH